MEKKNWVRFLWCANWQAFSPSPNSRVSWVHCRGYHRFFLHIRSPHSPCHCMHILFHYFSLIQTRLNEGICVKRRKKLKLNFKPQCEEIFHDKKNIVRHTEIDYFFHSWIWHNSCHAYWRGEWERQKVQNPIIFHSLLVCIVKLWAKYFYNFKMGLLLVILYAKSGQKAICNVEMKSHTEEKYKK